jgi:uncharacterized membrane protein
MLPLESSPARQHAALFVALSLASAVAGGMLVLRAFWSGGSGYSGLVWNLFLAWIPYALALWLASMRPARRAQWLLAAGVGCLWLLFLPNAPYLITDLIHLHPNHAMREREIGLLGGLAQGQRIPVWFDALLVFAFAWTGLLLAFASLDVVRRAVAARAGERWAWAATAVAVVLCSFGVALGRFDRFNSWEVFTQPHVVLPAVAVRMLNPVAHPRITLVTVLLTAFLMLGYITLLAMARTQQREPTPSRG